jgi:hypothetical protein
VIVYTHPCRIYRCRLSQKHDLSLLRNAEDIYEEDKWCRVTPSSAEILDIPSQGELQIVQRLVDLWFPAGLDIVEGYIIKVMKPRVLDGAREAVESTLDSSAAVGAVELELVSPWGFESGDVIEIVGTATEYAKIKTVEDYTATLYADEALTNGFSAGDVASVVEFYKIISLVVPPGMGPVIQAQATRIAHRSIG